jgi:hypothetical protein
MSHALGTPLRVITFLQSVCLSIMSSFRLRKLLVAVPRGSKTATF